MAIRTCKVTCLDISGIEHAFEVTAETLYEAVAMGLAALRDTEWTADFGHGQTTITVVVKSPEVEHKAVCATLNRGFNHQLDLRRR